MAISRRGLKWPLPTIHPNPMSISMSVSPIPIPSVFLLGKQLGPFPLGDKYILACLMNWQGRNGRRQKLDFVKVLFSPRENGSREKTGSQLQR